MKRLCGKAGVKECKVYPHNLRKLFARTFYGIEKDIAKLADILGLELIPEYDMPAHSNSLLKALPELRCSVDPEEYTSLWIKMINQIQLIQSILNIQ